MTTRVATRLLSQVQPDEPVAGNYFVAAYPPFSCWQPGQVPAVEEALQQPPPDAPVGLYVHVPFCQKKCDYCYYLSYVNQHPEVIHRYLEAVGHELGAYARRPGLQGRPVSFVYFGGGTPSMLTTDQVHDLAHRLQSALPWNGVQEVTFECAPRSVRRDFLEALREIGVTRVSMGVQSFDDALLKLNGRVHLAEDVTRAYAWIQEAGFDWVNLDLMTGLMGETWENWRESVRRIIELAPESVTVYQTEIPCNTQLYRDWRAGSLPGDPVSWEVKRARLDYAFGELSRAGYAVVSAYSAVKDPVRHRFLYQDYLWRGGDMLGLGVASFSYFGGVHFQNEVTLENYLDRVRQGMLPHQRAIRLTERDQLVREFILQLKWGEVEAAPFRAKFGVDLMECFAEALEALAARNRLTFSQSGVQLTGEGLLRVDGILPHFYDRQYQDVRYS